MTQEEREKLVRKIALILSTELEYEVETDIYDGLPCGLDITNAEILAEKAISLTVKAIDDGDLLLTKIPPELPGEVLRKTIWDMERIVGIQRGDTIIALRPAGKPSQEEEGCP